ncbi:hypothetical protein JKP88DRAFT_259387 [Tribonema minus]|uniref:Fe-S cluster assembly protein SufD n=1 Tax=Tribonema minus TaxID=303371 RepID=A0A836CQZ7_9STRA|nr:hypothetical protein JKP88DRAFT_259387 [Tribonema minus]
METGVNLAPKRADPRTWFGALQQQAATPAPFRELASAGAATLDEVDLPHRKQEPYRYTDLEAIFRHSYDATAGLPVSQEFAQKYLSEASKGQQLVFVNGRFNAQLSDTSAVPEGVYVGSALGAGEHQAAVMGVLDHLPEVGANKNTCQGSLPFAALNQACFADAAAVVIPPNVTVEQPIQVLFVTHAPKENEGGEGGAICHPRLAIVAGEGSSALVMQSYVGEGDYFANCVTRSVVGKGAKLSHTHSQEQSASAQHLDTVVADLAEEAVYSLSMVACGGLFARSNIQVELNGAKAHCNLNAAALCSGDQSVDFHTQMGHAAPDTTMEQQHRNIVADSSDCIFKGRVRVDGIAQGTDAHQLCRTLMLSDRARVTAMPSLEITADDVKCAHGATVADLDEESLFYLGCRGINAAEARALVIKGFAFDMIKALPDTNLQARVLEKLISMTPKSSRAVTAEGAFSSI